MHHSPDSCPGDRCPGDRCSGPLAVLAGFHSPDLNTILTTRSSNLARSQHFERRRLRAFLQLFGDSLAVADNRETVSHDRDVSNYATFKDLCSGPGSVLWLRRPATACLCAGMNRMLHTRQCPIDPRWSQRRRSLRPTFSIGLMQACSSVVEHCHYMAEVGGSIPSAPMTIMPAPSSDR